MAWPWHGDWLLEVCSWCVQMCATSSRAPSRKLPHRQHMHSIHVTAYVHISQQQIDMAEACFLDLAAMVQLLIQLQCVRVWDCELDTESFWWVYNSCEASSETGRTAELEAESIDWTIPTRLNSHVNNPSVNSQLQPHYPSWPTLTHTYGYERASHIRRRANLQKHSAAEIQSRLHIYCWMTCDYLNNLIKHKPLFMRFNASHTDLSISQLFYN